MHRNSKIKMKNDGVKFKIVGEKGRLTPFVTTSIIDK